MVMKQVATGRGHNVATGQGKMGHRVEDKIRQQDRASPVPTWTGLARAVTLSAAKGLQISEL